MTGSKYLLDTNIIIDIFEGNKTIAGNLNNLPEIFISSVVAGELFVGINRVRNKVKHLKKLNAFFDLCTILSIDTATAEHYGIIVASLYKKGKPIPTNDIWIAATAMQYNLVLATKDKHFNEIEKLKVEAW